MRTYSPKPGDADRQWHIIDATDVVLGRLASHTGVPVEMPKRFASTDAAIATVVSDPTGATITGRPRSAGCTCCSTLAK